MIIIIVIAFIIIMSITKLCHSVTLFIMKKNTTINLLEAFSSAVQLTTRKLTVIKMNKIYLLLYILMAILVFALEYERGTKNLKLKRLIFSIFRIHDLSEH